MSLVAALEDDTSDKNGKPSTPPLLTPSTSSIMTTRQNLHLAIRTSGALSASRSTILFQFEQNCIFACSFFIFEFEDVRICFFFYVSFICHCSIPVCSCRLSRAILTHIFSRLAGAQFIACMTCLTLQKFLFCFPQTITFLPVYLCFILNTSEHVSLPCFMHFYSFHPSVPPSARQSDHGPPPNRVGSIILVCESNPNSHLFVGTHSRLFNPVQAPTTSHLN